MRVFMNLTKALADEHRDRALLALRKGELCVCQYTQGACPRSDELCARAILVPIPSRLTKEQETAAAQIIRQSVTKP